MTKHLAIFSEPAIKAIFLGQKTVESRFSQKKIAPFGKISAGDLVYVKPPGKDIIGQFKVAKVLSFEGLDGGDWQIIKNNYGKQISLGSKALDQEFFQSHQNARFGTLIFINSLEQFITSPVKITKSDLRGWVVLE